MVKVKMKRKQVNPYLLKRESELKKKYWNKENK